MKVETYEITETSSDGTVDMLDEQAVALVNKLGLDGQKKLVENSGTGTKILLPYQEMATNERHVYELLFPQKTTVEVYESGPIPLRVLQVIAFAKDLFDKLEVWCPSTRAKDDPILVGRKGDQWSGKRYLLARWGDALKPFPELVKEAAVIARAQLSNKLIKALGDINQDIALLANIGDSFAIEWATRSPVYHDSKPTI